MNYYLQNGALVLSRLLWGYSLLIWARILLSWFVRYPKYGGFAYYISKAVDPYLRIFKKSTATVGRLDFSPIFAIGLIELVRSILSFYGTNGYLTLGLCLYYFLQAFWSYCLSFYFMFAIILLITKTIASFAKNPAYYNMGLQFGNAVSGLTNITKKLFFSSRIGKESTINLITLAWVIALNFGLQYLFGYLGSLALRLPI